MSEEERKEIQELINLLYNDHISQYGKRKLEAYINTILDLYQKEKEKNKKLNEEREHIKSNLQVDLVRKGVYAQARGQIKQILDYYENNDKYLENY